MTHWRTKYVTGPNLHFEDLAVSSGAAAVGYVPEKATLPNLGILSN